MIVRVPGSSANLGPGFDALGMAVALYAEAGLVDGAVPAGARVADQHHPASIAFARAGGHGEIWVRTQLPAGRGLGFSGAVRVAGAVLAHGQLHGSEPGALVARRPELLALTAALEGHADNVAASLLGGVTVAAGGRALRIPVALEAELVVWVPPTTTRTEQSRGRLPPTVALADAAFNVGHAALLVAALVVGDREAVRVAVADRLHQDARLATAPVSRAALDAAMAHGALGAWLSGSGPTVAALCEPGTADRIATVLPPDGRARVVALDQAGATIVP